MEKDEPNGAFTGRYASSKFRPKMASVTMSCVQKLFVGPGCFLSVMSDGTTRFGEHCYNKISSTVLVVGWRSCVTHDYCILRHHICGYAFCVCPTKRMPGLQEFFFFTLTHHFTKTFLIFTENIRAEAVLSSTYNLCFGAKIIKIGIPLYTPVYKNRYTPVYPSFAP